MSFEGLGTGALDYAPCKYGQSELTFRGPKRRLDAPYIAFLGGTETYGKFIKAPYPALVESDLGVNCVNFGVQNAGVDVFLHDPTLIENAVAAAVTVLQIVSATNLSNRLYMVHPRRNDRFVSASEKLIKLYPEVDFAEFHFTRHMLGTLYAVSSTRFAPVQVELENAWLARMKLLLRRLEGKVVLLWFADTLASEAQVDGIDVETACGPAFVTRDMVESLRPLVCDLVEVTPSPRAVAAGTEGMVFAETESVAAREILGPVAHGEAAARLTRVLQGLV